MDELSHRRVRKAVIEVLITIVEEKYGKVDTYEQLVSLLFKEFPDQEITLDEVLLVYAMSNEIADLQLQLSNIE